ncbi:MAG TPA: acetate kinase [Streptosporangiaceae bacterium]
MAGSPGSAGLVLVLNSGSSSVKYALVDPDTGQRPLNGQVEDIGTSGGSYHDAIAQILGHLDDKGHVDLAGAGHRVVHGGERFSASVLVDDEVLAAIRSFSHLAPLHNPANLAGIEAVSAARPGLPQVAVFDTAFHQSMKPAVYRYAVPDEWYARYGVRRYGFHGTSYRFVSERAATLLARDHDELSPPAAPPPAAHPSAAPPPAALRLVIAHLGNGCSAAAIADGQSVDTTMGLTPMEGLVMGTRSGDVDPGLLGYLAERTGQDATALTQALDTRSGLLGLSGATNDMRAIQDAAGKGDERARLALDVFVHRLAKAVAALTASLGGLDALVFTAGIGEHSPVVRSEVLARLGFLGLTEDPAANAAHGRATNGRISLRGPVQALVVPTDEELMIARDTARLVPGSRP